MHRAVCRVFRGTCRKWRENDVPVVSGEEVRKNQDKKEKFVPPGHSFNEALGWGGFLLLAYEVAHRRKYFFRAVSSDQEELTTAKPVSNNSSRKCLFPLVSLVTQALNQPTLYSSTKFVNSSKVESTTRHSRPSSHNRTALVKRSSIDTSPFLPEEFLTFSESESEIEDDDCSIFFDDNFDVDNTPKTQSIQMITDLSKPTDAETVAAAEQFTSDILSVYGAFKFFIDKKSPTKKRVNDPPLSAIQLLEKGAQFGSSRALYNIGIAYDRSGQVDLAKDYYRRAAAAGHILASYNLAVFYLREMTQLDEGMSLMRYAEKNGVPEAVDFFKDLNDTK